MCANACVTEELKECRINEIKWIVTQFIKIYMRSPHWGHIPSDGNNGAVIVAAVGAAVCIVNNGQML